MIAFGAISAYLFRMGTNHREIIHLSYAIGLKGDIARSFLLAFACTALWLLLWLIRSAFQYRQDRHPGPKLGVVIKWISYTSRAMSLFIIALVVMGAVSILVTKDIVFSSGQASSFTLNHIAQALAVVLAVIQLFALLPVFRLEKLVQSGAGQNGPAGSFFFNLIAPAILFGLPLLSFGYFAQEDISHRYQRGLISDFEQLEPDSMSDLASDHESNPRFLSIQSFRDWNKFWNHIVQQSERDPELENSSVEERLLAAARSANNNALLESQIVARQLGEAMENHPFLIGMVFDWKNWEFDLNRSNEIYKLRQQRDDTEQAVVEKINLLCLTDPGFYRALTDVLNDEDTEKITEQQRLELDQLVAQAHDLARDGVENFSKKDKNLRNNSLHDEQILSEYDSIPAWKAEVRRVNRSILQVYFGDEYLKPIGTITSYVSYTADQSYRILAFLISALLCLVMGLCISLNHTSLQSFYRDRLQEMWVSTANSDKLALSEFQHKEHPHYFPYLIINATAHEFRENLHSVLQSQSQTVARHSRFEFAPVFCGVPVAGSESNSSSQDTKHQPDRAQFEETSTFQKQPQLDLPGVMAISGSAVSPAMTDSWVLKILLFLSNVRFGSWVCRPNSHSIDDSRSTRRRMNPSIIRCMSEILNPFQRSQTKEFVFLSDGGHYENLGVEALLQRRVHTIVCVDAGQDGEGRFVDLLKLVRRSRAIHGISIESISSDGQPLEFDNLMNLKGKLAQQHYFVAKVRYPEKELSTGFLIYIKPSFTHDEPAELINYRDENPDFPHDPTLDQFYSERRFESYRMLGMHIAETVFRDLDRILQSEKNLTSDEEYFFRPPSSRSDSHLMRLAYQFLSGISEPNCVQMLENLELELHNRKAHEDYLNVPEIQVLKQVIHAALEVQSKRGDQDTDRVIKNFISSFLIVETTEEMRSEVLKDIPFETTLGEFVRKLKEIYEY